MIADHIGVSTNIVMFWLTPWRRTDEHLPLSHIAEVIHVRGFFWDAISVESSGGLNPLRVGGLPKSQALYFVEHVREWINQAAGAPPPPPKAIKSSCPAIAGKGDRAKRGGRGAGLTAKKYVSRKAPARRFDNFCVG